MTRSSSQRISRNPTFLGVRVFSKLCRALYARQPAQAFLGKLLHWGLQLGLLHMEIIHGADAQDTLARKPRADAVHEGAARGTEVVRHSVARGDGAGLTEGFQVFAAAQVRQVGVGDGEVGCEHGRGDLVAVRTVAGEALDQTRALGWLVLFGGDVRAEMDMNWGARREAGENGVRRQVTCTQTGSLRRQTYECQLHSATEACSRRFSFIGPAVTC